MKQRDLHLHAAKQSSSLSSSETCFNAGFFVTFDTQFLLAEVYAGASGLSYSTERGFEPRTISESLVSLDIMPIIVLSTTDTHLVLFVSSVLKADRFCE